MARWISRVVVLSSLGAMFLSTACGAGMEAKSPSRYSGGDAVTASMDEESTMDAGGMAYPQMGYPTAMAPPAEPAPEMPKGEMAKTAPGDKPGSGSAIDDPERKQPILIYTADFTMSVYEVSKSLDIVEGLAKDVGGFMSRREDRSVTIRVPAQKFQEVVLAIEKVGDVLHRNVVSEDVTAEYRDLEVQLANAVAMRARFEKLLEKANKVEEALAIERELGRITGEIERIKGRLKLLGDLARYSTITVNFSARNTEQVQQGPFVLPLPWLQNVSLPRLLAL